jgi:truncated hemoglobin YjbI
MDPTERYERGLVELQQFTASLREPSDRAKRIRELMEDEGMTRAEARAWLSEMEVVP